MTEASVRFRRATRDDLAHVVRLLADDELGVSREVSPDSGSEPEEAYQRAFAAIDADENQLLVVADAGPKIVGTLQLTYIPNLTFRGGERAQIEGVRVDSAHRGSGLGRRLVEWAVDEARSRGCLLVQLTTNKERTAAQRFYESLGFVASHEGMKLML